MRVREPFFLAFIDVHCLLQRLARIRNAIHTVTLTVRPMSLLFVAPCLLPLRFNGIFTSPTFILGRSPLLVSWGVTKDRWERAYGGEPLRRVVRGSEDRLRVTKIRRLKTANMNTVLDSAEKLFDKLFEWVLHPGRESI
jgi:hypothetical protein